jgi:excisionase family DNA binding protein
MPGPRPRRRLRVSTRDETDDSAVGRGLDQAGNETPDRLLDVNEAAGMLGLKSPRTLYKWSYEGRIRSVKISRSVRFYRSDVQRILIEGERPAFASLSSQARERAAWGAR